MNLDLKKTQALFWDFDGVIVESLSIKTDAFKELFIHYGSRIVEKVERLHLENGGMSRFEKFDIIYRDFLQKPLAQKEKEFLSEKFSNIVFQKMITVSEVPGAIDFIQSIYTTIPCFVISGTPENELKDIIQKRQWNHFFKDIKGSPEIKTTHLNSLLSTYLFDPKQCLFFGDASTDLETAHTFNMPFILRNHSYNRDLQSKLKKQDYAINNFTPLITI